MLDVLQLVRELVALPGPPGQEDAVREAVAAHAERLGCVHQSDAWGNLLIAPPGVKTIPDKADIVVMAHLDEIALLVVRVEDDGRLVVTNMGGLFPFKWGEAPVCILAPGGALTGIVSFGGIHTLDAAQPAVKGKEAALTWADVRIFTGLSAAELQEQGVRPGTRVVLHPSRRVVTEFGDFWAAPFLDDRADLAAMLLALQSWSGAGSVVFAATASEEVGGHGALALLRRLQPTVGIALEIGPRVPESDFPIDAQPTVWVNDFYSAIRPSDITLVAEAAESIGLQPHFQALSRGGSDASCGASHGLVARPITLAFAAENSHGTEIMHRDAVPNLAALLGAVLSKVSPA